MNSTTDCVAQCDQGDGSAAASEAYAKCRDGCISSYIIVSGTAAPGGDYTTAIPVGVSTTAAAASGSGSAAAGSGASGMQLFTFTVVVSMLERVAMGSDPPFETQKTIVGPLPKEIPVAMDSGGDNLRN
jgi:hypothetical protein